jgi:hypothetical protein
VCSEIKQAPKQRSKPTSHIVKTIWDLKIQTRAVNNDPIVDHCHSEIQREDQKHRLQINHNKPQYRKRTKNQGT